MAIMRAEVMEFYGLTRSPRSADYYETAHHRKLLKDIRQAVYDSDLIALCGVVGSGKTVTLRRLQDMLAEDGRVLVSKSVAVEKDRATLGTLITALFCDLTLEKEPKIRLPVDRFPPSDPPRRSAGVTPLSASRLLPLVPFPCHDRTGSQVPYRRPNEVPPSIHRMPHGQYVCIHYIFLRAGQSP